VPLLRGTVLEDIAPLGGGSDCCSAQLVLLTDHALTKDPDAAPPEPMIPGLEKWTNATRISMSDTADYLYPRTGGRRPSPEIVRCLCVQRRCLSFDRDELTLSYSGTRGRGPSGGPASRYGTYSLASLLPATCVPGGLMSKADSRRTIGSKSLLRPAILPSSAPLGTLESVGRSSIILARLSPFTEGKTPPLHWR